MKLLLVDEHCVMREALARVLLSEPDVEAVRHAESAREAVAVQEQAPSDVVLTELSLSDRAGTELIRELKAFPGTRVLVLSAHRDDYRVAEAMRAGADGYLTKRTRLAALLDAIRGVVKGKAAVSPDVSGAMVRALQRRDGGNRGDVLSALSERERQVLRLLALGRSAKEVAAQLAISVKTVETHRARLCAKVATHSVADLTRLAVRAGLVEL